MFYRHSELPACPVPAGMAYAANDWTPSTRKMGSCTVELHSGLGRSVMWFFRRPLSYGRPVLVEVHAIAGISGVSGLGGGGVLRVWRVGDESYQADCSGTAVYVLAASRG
jgi:hypothetical protein